MNKGVRWLSLFVYNGDKKEFSKKVLGSFVKDKFLGGILMKKKIVSLMLVAAMSVSLCACGGGKEAGEEAPAGTEQAVGTEEGAVNEGPDMEAYGAESAEL